MEVPKPSLPELGVPYRDEVEQSGSTLQSSVNDLQHEAAGMRRRLRMPDVD